MAWLGIIALGLTAELATIVVLGRAVTHRDESVPVTVPAARPPAIVRPREPATAERLDHAARVG